jgi:hypothetical protein
MAGALGTPQTLVLRTTGFRPFCAADFLSGDKSPPPPHLLPRPLSHPSGAPSSLSQTEGAANCVRMHKPRCWRHRTGKKASSSFCLGKHPFAFVRLHYFPLDRLHPYLLHSVRLTSPSTHTLCNI